MNKAEGVFAGLRQWLRARLSDPQWARLKRVRAGVLGPFCRGNLPRLALLHGTDKWGGHWYAQHYARHFHHLRRKRITLLEIGVGGYSVPQAGGGSLRMWRTYFPKGKIVGLDYFDKSPHQEARIRIFRGDQSDEKFLSQVIAEIGRPDIIIDDGSHLNPHVLKSFEVLFPLLADDGIYVVEDTQTAYWPEAGGSSDDLPQAHTSMRLFKSLVDGLNHEEFLKPGYVPSYHDQHITALHFYHNLVFIQKGLNNEGSNFVRQNKLTGDCRFD